MWPFTWKPKIKNTLRGSSLYYRLKGIVGSDCIIHYDDMIYQVPEDPADVIAHSPSSRYEYIKEKRDCGKS